MDAVFPSNSTALGDLTQCLPVQQTQIRLAFSSYLNPMQFRSFCVFFLYREAHLLVRVHT